MEKYLKELRTELEKINITEEEIRIIIENHQRMFELGREASLKDEVIIKNIGKPKDVAKRYIIYDEKNDETIELIKEAIPGVRKIYNPHDQFNLNINLAQEKIYIEYHDEDNITIVISENAELEDYDISFLDNSLNIKCKKKSFVFKGKKNRFNIYLPKKTINSLIVKQISGETDITSVICLSIYLSTINGTIEAGVIKAKDIKVNNVCGNVRIRGLDGDSASIKNVSGNVIIKKLLSDCLKTASVAGNIEILEGNKSWVKASTLAGRIKVSDEIKKNKIDCFKEEAKGTKDKIISKIK